MRMFGRNDALQRSLSSDEAEVPTFIPEWRAVPTETKNLWVVVARIAPTRLTGLLPPSSEAAWQQLK